MRKVILSLALLAAGLLAASDAAAQCGSSCVAVRPAPEEPIVGYGCINANNNNHCQATEERCRSLRCYNAMLTDTEGRMLASATRCGGDGAKLRIATLGGVPRPKLARSPRGDAALASRAAPVRPAAD